MLSERIFIKVHSLAYSGAAQPKDNRTTSDFGRGTGVGRISLEVPRKARNHASTFAFYSFSRTALNSRSDSAGTTCMISRFNHRHLKNLSEFIIFQPQKPSNNYIIVSRLHNQTSIY